MIDMYDLIAYIKHTGCPWEILTADGVVNREWLSSIKSHGLKYVDSSVVVNCTFTGSQKLHMP